MKETLPSMPNRSPGRLVNALVHTAGALMVVVVPCLLLWAVTLAYLPQANLLMETAMCGADSHMEIAVEREVVAVREDPMDEHSPVIEHRVEEQTSVYCRGEGNKDDVSTQVWLYLSAYTSLALAALAGLYALLHPSPKG